MLLKAYFLLRKVHIPNPAPTFGKALIKSLSTKTVVLIDGYAHAG